MISEAEWEARKIYPFADVLRAKQNVSEKPDPLLYRGIRFALLFEALAALLALVGYGVVRMWAK